MLDELRINLIKAQQVMKRNVICSAEMKVLRKGIQCTLSYSLIVRTPWLRGHLKS